MEQKIVVTSELEAKIARLAIGNFVTNLDEMDLALEGMAREWGVTEEEIVTASENLARNNGYENDFVTVSDTEYGAIYCANCGRQVGIIPPCRHCEGGE